MNTDVVIVGGGPAGASAALYLLRKGINPIIIEKENFPRYHIGESLTGECGGILRNLGLEQEMAQASYPIKHGVRVYGHNHWFVPVRARTENGLRDVSTWQVRRSEFDKMLLVAALSRGATLIRGQRCVRSACTGWRLSDVTALFPLYMVFLRPGPRMAEVTAMTISFSSTSAKR